jgi:hypothetical protein
MAASLTQLLGGAFQDANGAVLAFGYLTLKLSQDGNVSGVGNICSGVTITIYLDVNGNVGSSTSPTPVADQYVWANSNIFPINTYYKVTGYTQDGQRAFGLNNQQVAAGATFNVGTWVPNSVISWFPEIQQSLTLEINGTPASSQTLQNLEAGANITITDEGSGNIQIAAGGGTEFNIADQGWFLGGQDYGSVSAGATIHTNNVVNCVQVVLQSTWVISSVAAVTITGEGSNGGMTCALYSADGNTKVIDAGANFLDMSNHSQWTGIATLATPVTLTPGIYWFAWGSYDSANGGSVFSHLDVPGMTLCLNNWSFPYSATVPPVRFGSAANAISAGLMPTSLGTITPFQYGGEPNVPVVMFRV